MTPCEALFTCRVPVQHRTVFENYVMIQLLAASGNGSVRTRDPVPGKNMMTVTVHVIAETLTLVERARSRISGRAIELSKPQVDMEGM